MDQIKVASSRAEDVLERWSRPLKPQVPRIARALLVSTFIEDSLRIVMQWQHQLLYLQVYRGFPWGLSHIFLVLNVAVMLTCSSFAIVRKYTELDVIGLFFVVFGQGIAYGLISDYRFFLRNLSVVGGLCMLLAESILSKRRTSFAGLPSMQGDDTSKYIILGGRLLLVLLFASFLFSGEMTFLRGVVVVIGGMSCIMVAVGFKAKFSATVLVMILSLFNLLVNNWWSIDYNPTHRDFVKYDFFQTLSIVGGFLLLISVGPGGISVDKKKKEY